MGFRSNGGWNKGMKRLTKSDGGYIFYDPGAEARRKKFKKEVLPKWFYAFCISLLFTYSLFIYEDIPEFLKTFFAVGGFISLWTTPILFFAFLIGCL
tara:strand:+ start:200 stop:490 length:291 start_codon:yes stop_codon:yes gene_type:complete